MTTPPRRNDPFAPAPDPDPTPSDQGPASDRFASDRGLAALSGAARVPVSRRPDEASARTGTGIGAGKGQGKGRRGPADPVRALMHRHHDLCARAVDPLEIAAGLEAHGVTDRTAARFRHRDVFSLAEELYARVPRAEEPALPAAAAPGRALGVRMTLAALWLLPGALCAATASAALRVDAIRKDATIGLALGAGGAALTLIALWLCLRHGPLRVRGRGAGRGGRIAHALGTGWLLGYAAAGDWLLTGLLDGRRPYDAAPAAGAAVVLALAAAPAAWCARWFAVGARRRLAVSRGLEEFASGVRPLFAGVVTAFLCALAALVPAARLTVPGSPPATAHLSTAEGAAVALCGLLFLARLLAVHGFRRAALSGIAVACAVQATALATTAAARLPGAGPLGEPVARLTAAQGAAAVPAAACGAAALALLIHAFGALCRASAHGGPGARTARPARDPRTARTTPDRAPYGVHRAAQGAHLAP
ncbi:hypothetical protein VT50_0218555 [Streptomyces antioxidans]|uniref:Integral membrane protein n=1 Tax=Streptomyces antioxidans TaxID=1507734 RepID=A0A1V4D4E3_9ACTN|nr:hypothetical protein [Streptomyces antioxidans]OPF78752.1 hypothetical protein VT50_0218555 [Streptomyces antioxidans]